MVQTALMTQKNSHMQIRQRATANGPVSLNSTAITSPLLPFTQVPIRYAQSPVITDRLVLFSKRYNLAVDVSKNKQNHSFRYRPVKILRAARDEIKIAHKVAHCFQTGKPLLNNEAELEPG